MSGELERLSDDAKAVAGGWFGLMAPGKGELTFMLSEARPSDRAQAALDELVRAGVIAVSPYNDLIGLRYVPLVSCRAASQWLAKNRENPSATFPVTAPLKNRAEGKRVRVAALAVKKALTNVK